MTANAYTITSGSFPAPVAQQAHLASARQPGGPIHPECCYQAIYGVCQAMKTTAIDVGKSVIKEVIKNLKWVYMSRVRE